jgi:hypothetical protein
MHGMRYVAAAMLAGTLCVLGCRVEADKSGDGKNVRIATPFGGMEVKTDDTKVLEELGLPGYPGAVLAKDKDKGKKDNDGAADVNFSFGSFQLRVKAASYRTTDSPELVRAFYRKALGRYGDVIECQNNKAVGMPVQTAEGLTCDNEKANHISLDDNLSGKTELKAGSKLHQHIVGIDPEGTGTKFGLVALDLPGHIGAGDNGEEHKQ